MRLAITDGDVAIWADGGRVSITSGRLCQRIYPAWKVGEEFRGMRSFSIVELNSSKLFRSTERSIAKMLPKLTVVVAAWLKT